MRKLGLIGGMGPESTVPYYQGITRCVRAQAGRFPLIALESVDVFYVLMLETEGRLDELCAYLGKALQRVAAAGAQVAALCANTPHIVFDQLQRECPIPLVSIVDACCAEAQRHGFTKVGLMGTAPTMDSSFYQRSFARAGIELVVPDKADQRYIAQKIADELEFGILREDTRVGLAATVKRMRDAAGIQAVVLGCTELPLILNDALTCVPCLDTLDIHIRALVEAVLAE